MVKWINKACAVSVFSLNEMGFKGECFYMVSEKYIYLDYD